MSEAVLTWALPKGRILEEARPLLQAAGADMTALDAAGRKLDVSLGPEHRGLLLKPWDVATYVELGVAQIGMVGLDVLREREPDVYEPLDLGIGRCRMVVAGPDGAPRPRSAGPLVVASKYPSCTRKHFASKGQPVEVVTLYGSVELAAATGLAECIVDLVASGATLRDNALRELEPVLEVTARLVVNRAWFQLHTDRVRRIMETLQGVLG